MLSLRALSRAVSRSASRPLLSACRPVSVAPRASFLESTWRSVQRPAYSAFSTSATRKEPAGDSDQELSAKIDQEWRLERETRDSDVIPPSVQDFLDNSKFEIQDKPGTQDVLLTKTFGNETIKVEFSIADLNSLGEDSEMDEDTAMEDEEEDFGEEMRSQKRTINQSGARGGAVDVMPEDSIAPADRSDEAPAGEDDGPVPYPINLDITITKPGKGAVEVRAAAQDGLIQIENIFYYPKAELVDAMTPEDQKEQQSIYGGPPFMNLDQELQSMLERYLDERGINTALAAFLPDYVDYKEQREYVQWLDNMKKFVEA